MLNEARALGDQPGPRGFWSDPEVPILAAGAVPLTGGSSLALTAAGGLAGATMGGSKQCPALACVLDDRKLRRRVLADERLRRLPMCATEYESVFLKHGEELPALPAMEREILGPRPSGAKRKLQTKGHRRR